MDANLNPTAALSAELASAASQAGPGAAATAGPTPGPAAASPEALDLARDAYSAADVSGTRLVATRGTAETLLARLDQLDRQFLDSIGGLPKVDVAAAGTPEGMVRLSAQLLEHQASLTRATVGISMVSTGTTSFRDGVKQVLSSQ
jgi:hypothetical protein